jgi:hypothetical protein
MSVLVCTLQGRFGNQVMQYLFARAFADTYGLELHMDPWIGERVFAIEHPRPKGAITRRYNEVDFRNWRVNFEVWRLGDVEFRGYAQSQDCMIYTKRAARHWLKLRPEIETACAHAVLASTSEKARIVIHQRRGDYHGYGYPTVSTRSYIRALDHFGLRSTEPECVWLSEEKPIPHAGHLPDDLSFMPDFYRMMTAPTLLRGNSSFSWLAGLLGDGLVLSPIIDGCEGGKEHDCPFVAGNWPRFANLDFVENLHVAP